jgi:hypothetical protein
MRTRPIVKAAFAIVCFMGPALADGDDSDAPARFHKNGITEILHALNKPLALNPYPNITNLGKAFSVTCHSATGCIVTLTSEMNIPDAGLASMCAYVDGVPMRPFCGREGQNEAEVMQGQRVSQGTHTLQMTIESDTTETQNACPCEFSFTFYDDAD